MIFTSLDYAVFLTLVFLAYWTVGRKNLQNVLLVAVSYFFYGFIHPWFCILLAATTVVDYFCGLGIYRFPAHRTKILSLSLIFSLSLLATFKYFNFFVDNLVDLFANYGLELSKHLIRIVLPVGISFYTFQSMSYTIDVYRGKQSPTKNFVEYALYASFFPLLVSGPIERASHFLPQIRKPRVWNWDNFDAACSLLIRGFLKKLVVADNLAYFVNKIFVLDQPSLDQLLIGVVGFSFQIYADFSGYTDIARGTASLLGFDLVENFKSPYLAVSPSDFWRRWHISLSSWFRDYLYIPLGGSLARDSKLAKKYFNLHSHKLAADLGVLLVTMGLCGFWHGAAWNFLLWGVYHGVLLFGYRLVGLGGSWRPNKRLTRLAAVTIMYGFTLGGWLLFRSPSLSWLVHVFSIPVFKIDQAKLLVDTVIAGYYFIYGLPLLFMFAMERWSRNSRWLRAAFDGAALAAIFLLSSEFGQDFIYFQF